MLIRVIAIIYFTTIFGIAGSWDYQDEQTKAIDLGITSSSNQINSFGDLNND